MGNTIERPETPVSQGFVKPVPHVPRVPRENDRSRTVVEIEREERAAVLEFDEGLTRTEAEAVAAKEVSTQIASKPQGGRPQGGATGAHSPAIEVPHAEYDRQADMLIAAAIAAGRDPGRLHRQKAKGHVIERGEDWIFVRGRW